MSLPVIAQLISSIIAVCLVGYTVVKQRNSKMLYFICYVIFIAIFSAGYLLEMTAPTLEAAVTACKVQYMGIPFIAPFFYLFCRDYCNAPHRGGRYVLALMTLPLLFMVLVFTWPASTLYYANLTFVTTPTMNRLAVQPGALYYVGFAYSYVCALGGIFLISRYYLRSRAPDSRRHLAVLLLAFLLVLVCQVLTAAELLPGGFTPFTLTLVVTALMFQWHLMRFRAREWSGLGRESVLENMKDAFVLLDTEGRFLDANAMAYAYFPKLEAHSAGSPMGGVTGFPLELLGSEKDACDFTLGEGDGITYLRASQSPLEVDGSVIGTCVMIYDTSENHMLLNDLQAMAATDSLTGLYNRGTFFQHAQRDFALAVRSREPASLLMMDIDFFKLVNDMHGHQVGDKVLSEIADVLTSRLRQTDITGRYGGEELVVWLPGAPAEGAAIIADVIRRAVEHTPFESENGRFNVTISIGVCELDFERHPSLDSLIADADSALYQAKSSGRNKVCIYQPASAAHPAK